MSLNRKRRIFRPEPASFSLRNAGRGKRRVILALAVCLGVVIGGSWMMGRPSQAPASGPGSGRLIAPAAVVAVVDGGTLRVQDRVVRLDGVDAPARGQSCREAEDSSFDCGAAAASALAALIRDGRMECDWNGRDPVGRPLAICSVRGVNVNRALIAQGWARASTGSGPLATAEAEARAARRGLWAGSGTAIW
ncbi:MAG: thermonuclease family protein [Acetobacteraceae bacterium]